MNAELIILDWDGTLSVGRFWAGLDPARYTQVQQTLFVENRPLVDRWMCGLVDSDHVNAWLAERIGVDHAVLSESLAASCRSMTLTEELRASLATLRSRTRLALVTDNMDCFSRYTAPTNRLGELFHTIINSADVGRLKNDQQGRTLRETVERYCPFEAAVLIDDSDSTREMFTRLGGRSIKTGGPTQTAHILGDIVDV